MKISQSRMLSAAAGLLIAANVFGGEAPNKAILDAAEKYIFSDKESKEVQKQVAAYKGPVTPVIDALKKKEDAKARIKTAVNKPEPFACPAFTTDEFKKKFPGACLYYYTPKNFDPAKKYGLLVFLHGGGNGVMAKQAGFYVTKYELDKRIQEADAPYIIVAPSFDNPKGVCRWLAPKCDEFIDSVIRESRQRFHIDPDRIAVGGFSMGGGAWRHAQRLNDIACAGLSVAGGWNVINFKPNKHIPMFIVIGQYDGFVGQMNRYGGKKGAGVIPKEKRTQQKRHKNDPAIFTDDKLTEMGIPHVFKWHLGGHTLLDEAKPAMQEFANWLKEQKRNPNPKEVIALTPRGAYCHIKGTKQTPHTFWISILETTGGALPYYNINSQVKSGSWRPVAGETPETYRLRVKTIIGVYGGVKGGWVDAVNKGNNTFEIKTKNIKKFAIWLNSKMVDFSKPVTVIVDGVKKEYKDLKPNLLDALRSYKRRYDWELIYPCELIVDVK